jgi:hypothetical protein
LQNKRNSSVKTLQLIYSISVSLKTVQLPSKMVNKLEMRYKIYFTCIIFYNFVIDIVIVIIIIIVIVIIHLFLI